MNENKTLWILLLLGVVVAALILFIDHNHKTDSEVKRNVNSLKETLRNDRKFIRVEAIQMRNLIVGASADRDLAGLKGPFIRKENNGWKAFIDVKEGVTPYGLDKLLGDSQNQEWDSCYSVGNNLHFDAEIDNGDTIVSCPAYFLAKLVEYYENQQLNED